MSAVAPHSGVRQTSDEEYIARCRKRAASWSQRPYRQRDRHRSVCGFTPYCSDGTRRPGPVESESATMPSTASFSMMVTSPLLFRDTVGWRPYSCGSRRSPAPAASSCRHRSRQRRDCRRRLASAARLRRTVSLGGVALAGCEPAKRMERVGSVPKSS